MQTILGAGGAVGIPLAKELKAYTDKIRLVSRNPQKVNPDDELFPADLTDRNAVHKALEGASVVYLTAGLRYSRKVWRRDWPLIMTNVIDACIEHNAKLVFLDNVYMYAPGEIPHMTETSVNNPASEKGKVRAALIRQLFDAVQHRGLHVLVARSADFYGPAVENSPLVISVADKFRNKQKAFWMADAGKVHSFTYIPDAAKATALLGNTADAFNEIWHLPTAPERFTGKEYITMVAEAMQVQPRYYIFSKLMMGLIGLFVPLVGELKEMAYQYDRDYFFDSSKFNRRFGFVSTSYAEGIKTMVAAYK